LPAKVWAATGRAIKNVTAKACADFIGSSIYAPVAKACQHNNLNAILHTSGDSGCSPIFRILLKPREDRGV
jgi:hypothetical protein